MVRLPRLDLRITDDLGHDHAIPAAEWAKGDHPSPRIKFVLREAAAIATGTGAEFGKKHILFVILVALVIVFVFVSIRTTMPGWMNSAVYVVPGAAVGIAMRRAYFKKHKAQLVRMMTHNGLCAACGYEMVEARSDDAGFKHCPECDAAWRPDRFPTRSVAGPGVKEESDLVVRTLASVSRWPRRTRGITDHRRSPSSLLTRTPREAASPADVPQLQERRREADRAVRARRRADRLTIIMLGSALGAFMAWMMVTGATHQRSTSTAVLSWIMVGVLLLMFAGWIWAVWTDRMFPPPQDLDETLLSLELCPNCSEDLAPRPIEPDGCRICRVCACAWRLIPIPQHVRPASSAMFGVMVVEHDDAGKPAMLDRASWKKSVLFTDPGIVAGMNATSRAVPSGLATIACGLFLGLAAFSIVEGIAIAKKIALSTATPIGLGAGVIALTVFLAVRALSDKPQPSEIFTMRAKRLGVCPACGYQILDLPPGEDGFTACPECGGKWLVRAPTDH